MAVPTSCVGDVRRSEDAFPGYPPTSDARGASGCVTRLRTWLPHGTTTAAVGPDSTIVTENALLCFVCVCLIYDRSECELDGGLKTLIINY